MAAHLCNLVLASIWSCQARLDGQVLASKPLLLWPQQDLPQALQLSPLEIGLRLLQWIFSFGRRRARLAQFAAVTSALSLRSLQRNSGPQPALDSQLCFAIAMEWLALLERFAKDKHLALCVASTHPRLWPCHPATAEELVEARTACVSFFARQRQTSVSTLVQHSLHCTVGGHSSVCRAFCSYPAHPSELGLQHPCTAGLLCRAPSQRMHLHLSL
mmetsp:Transcript_23103/g.53090  ORF Transcript_23103/g.53090 Transcript_23103/m.53090 type:complete len:216 (-) Transcript_23103:1109-1756(-)